MTLGPNIGGDVCVLAANNAVKNLRLVTKQDWCKGGDRTIVYNLVDNTTGLAASDEWWVTEHLQTSTKTNSGGTDEKANQYTDFLSQYLTPNPYKALQSFTISPVQGPSQSIPVIVNIGGQDYGTLGLWISKNPLRNGQPSPNITNCPPN
jgi:hypothetical protein